MRLAVTGTPGTGKTTATHRLRDRDAGGFSEPIEVIHLNEVIREQGLSTGTDPERDSLIADLDAIEEWLDKNDGGPIDGTDTASEIVVVDSHLAHHLPADRVVVLRCHPERLESRLRERGEPDAKARENAESEALDVILAEAVETYGTENVFEIDTTERTPEAVADEIGAVMRAERDPSAGTVSFMDYLSS